MTYNASEVEKKWQAHWGKERLYEVDLKSAKKKYYNLVMFPYPSGDKLHIGHWYNFGPADSWGRHMKMKGHNVFEPMGFDAFGLPAENYAIKHGVHPTKSIAKNVEYMIGQLHRIGAMYDWDRMVDTSQPDYYKWTQWLFLQMYKNGLAERRKAPVNWCPSCQTVLANEQVEEGQCERCGAEVTKKDLTQWFWKISDYAERLLDYSKLQWPEKTVLMQKNWIGKSEGSEVVFAVKGSKEIIKVFTTRADTLFGATYMVLAPEHPLTLLLAIKEHKVNVEQYIEKARKETDIVRSAADREKTGVFIGAYAINPVNNEEIPIWTGDYVLPHYGTGAVMAVPAHDERDFAFAKKYGLPIKVVIDPEKSAEKGKVCFSEDGVLINSGSFNGIMSAEARKEITKWLEKKKIGKPIVNYKLRDWLISRQRYWGAPIPIVYCAKCGEVPVPEKDLPVKLPLGVDFQPKGTGQSPLATSVEFVNTKCPKCKGKARRETDTMDTFVDSSFYFLRYLDAKNKKKPWSTALVKKWLPVDMYIGGPEHACMHLLYARFVHKALYDFGFVPKECGDEPFKRLVHQGLITYKGAKMSKSKGNVVSPDDFVEQYGSDVFRLYLMFMGPYTDGGDWNDQGIIGVARFTERFYHLMTSEGEVRDENSMRRLVHKTLKRVSEDIEQLHFNTAIAALMEFVNNCVKFGIDMEHKKLMCRSIAPIAPHLAEEIWEELGGEKSVFYESYPMYEAKYLVEETIPLIVQINGKLRGKVMVSPDISEKEAILQAREEENAKRHLMGKKILKEIFVRGKLVNFVVKE